MGDLKVPKVLLPVDFNREALLVGCNVCGDVARVGTARADSFVVCEVGEEDLSGRVLYWTRVVCPECVAEFGEKGVGEDVRSRGSGSVRTRVRVRG